MSDINKYLLSHFYGFNDDPKTTKFLSSSKGIESFENVTDIEYSNVENFLLSEEIRKHQNAEEFNILENLQNGMKEHKLSKSPHILTIEEFLEESEKVVSDEEDCHSEDCIIDNFKDDKNIATKNFTRLEDDTFTKAIAKISKVPDQEASENIPENNLNLNLPCSPVRKAKKLWHQKTMLSKEKSITSLNKLSNFDGLHLNLNKAGICSFPVDILQQLSNLQMLYLESNNLIEIPDTFFTTLKNLKWLDLRNNQLINIPSSIKGHKFLETLLLQRNNIEKLPLELGLVPNLKNLQTAHNPLIFPPSKIMDKNCSEIINFLRNEWNKNHSDEIVELKKINDNKINKKPSTIICYQPKSKQKSLKIHECKNSFITPKTSVRSRAWNYKPSSRYELRKNVWTLKKIENFENNLEHSVVICNFCAASLYRKGIFIENNIDTSCNNNKKKIFKTIKKSLSRSSYHTETFFRETIMNELNFLHLLGPSPRSLFIRKNFNFLINHKQINVKLCKVEPENFYMNQSKKINVKNVKAFKKINSKKTVYNIITNDRVEMEINPLQLKDPPLMLGFLKTFLGLSKQKIFIKNKKKI